MIMARSKGRGWWIAPARSRQGDILVGEPLHGGADKEMSGYRSEGVFVDDGSKYLVKAEGIDKRFPLPDRLRRFCRRRSSERGRTGAAARTGCSAG